MRTHSQRITLGVAAGLLVLIGASLLQAQQQPRDSVRETGAVTQTDTVNQPGMGADTGKVSKPGAGGYRYTGPPTDTALKAKPGVQTGPARSDRGAAVAPDTTTAPGSVNRKGAGGFRYTGAASDTALHAQPGTQTGRTAADTGKVKTTKHRRHHVVSDSTHTRSDSTPPRPN
jgi:hypothetical protein